jgi:hypothetical protein
MQQVLSLTKHYVFPRLIGEIAGLRPGMSPTDVRRHLGSPHEELFDDLFRYGPDSRLKDSILLRTCRNSDSATALRVLWTSLVAADYRLRSLMKHLVGDTGALIPSKYSTTRIEGLLEIVTDVPSRKAASNIAHYFEQARLLVPSKSGSEIIGVGRQIDTSDSVPACVSYLEELKGWKDTPCERAIKLGANGWLLLSAQRFTTAYRHGL